MKKSILILFIFSFNLIFSQESLIINDAIEMALTSSNLSRKANTELTYSETDNNIFRKRFLPNIYLSSTFPAITKSVTQVTTPEGQDIFVNQNQAYYDLTLNVEQNEPLFGGVFTLSSFFNRIDLFGDFNNKTYYSTPFSLSYSNTSFFFNPNKYEKNINRLKLYEANLEYNVAIENIVYKTVEKYFNNYINSENIKDNYEAQKSQKEIYNIAKKRFQIGSVNKGDLLSLELNILNTESTINDLTSKQKTSQKELATIIKYDADSLQLKLPTNNIISLDITYQTALAKMLENDLLMNTLKRQRAEKDLEIRKQKSEDKLTFDISASAGLSNTGESFSKSTSNLQTQQSFSVSLKYYLFDFGKNKQKVKLLNLEKESLENTYSIEIDELKEELYSLVDLLKNNQQKIIVLKKKLEVSKERYAFLKSRFSLGKGTISNLNLSQRENREIGNEYLETIQDIWLSYYKIRKLTMYDFENDKAISYK